MVKTEQENVRLTCDLRGLLIEILEVDPDLRDSEIFTRLPQAYERLSKLRAELGSLQEIAIEEPEIAPLLERANQALTGESDLSLDTAATALKEAREKFLVIIAERDEQQRQSKISVANILGKEAQIAATRFEFAQAVDFYRQQLDQYRDVLGENHPNTARSYNNLASNLEAQGRHEDAQLVRREAKKIGHE